MNNEFNIVQDYLKELLDSDDNVKLVTRVPFDDIGIQKNMTYPFVNIDYQSASYQDGKVIFKFIVYALAKRDINTKPIKDWWTLNDNRVENLRITELIARRFIMGLNNLNDYDIAIENNPEAEAGVTVFMDMLDGHQIPVDISITNNMSVC